MESYSIFSIREHPQLLQKAAKWFHHKWGIPEEAYLESMEDSLKNTAVPYWLVAMDKDMFIGGLGVIENDFHDRKDLAPNVCAVYVEQDYRCRGIAGALLNRVCDDMAAQGVTTLYLLTDHTGFYERYGWGFFCRAQGDGEENPSRMYIHRTENI